jgi:hypothetical protein
MHLKHFFSKNETLQNKEENIGENNEVDKPLETLEIMIKTEQEKLKNVKMKNELMEKDKKSLEKRNSEKKFSDQEKKRYN